MIAAVFGPSGSDRRMYSLMVLALLMAPACTLVARLCFPGATLLSNVVVGTLVAALGVCLTITLYSTGRMVYQGICETTRNRPGRPASQWNDEADLDTSTPAGSLSV